jgi:methenyltetrahydromethanopterin cyclohydrolase
VNVAVVKNAIGPLDKLRSKAQAALWQVEVEIYGHPGYGPDRGTYEHPRAAMSAYLAELHDILLVVLEATEMPDTRGLGLIINEGFFEVLQLEHECNAVVRTRWLSALPPLFTHGSAVSRYTGFDASTAKLSYMSF